MADVQMKNVAGVIYRDWLSSISWLSAHAYMLCAPRPGLINTADIYWVEFMARQVPSPGNVTM